MLLRQKLDLLIRKVFGASSEKLDPSQLDLFLLKAENAPGKSEASPVLEEADAAHGSKASPRSYCRPQDHLPDDLPVIEEVLDPEEVKEAPEAWRCIGAEVTEQLDYEPARFLLRRLVRRKYVSKLDYKVAPVIAALPPTLQQRNTVSAVLLAQIIVSKEALGLLVRSSDGVLRRARNLALACLLEAVRDQTKCVDLKQVNRVLLQPHWRSDADFLPNTPTLPSHSAKK